MNFSERMKSVIQSKDSYVCVGLDTDTALIPDSIKGAKAARIFDFNRSIIESTLEYTSAYKLNSAFYEAEGEPGMEALRRTIEAIPGDTITILDAKRADIGNTSALYARAVFEQLNADAVTVTPYMGFDSIQPFLGEENRGVVVLCLTSNESSKVFQRLLLADGRPVYMEVDHRIVTWNTRGNVGIVVGANHPDELAKIREIAPDIPMLIPGIGAQKGDLDRTVRAGIGGNRSPALINSSRGIIYSSSGTDFAEAAGRKCRELRIKINERLSEL